MIFHPNIKYSMFCEACLYKLFPNYKCVKRTIITRIGKPLWYEWKVCCQLMCETSTIHLIGVFNL